MQLAYTDEQRLLADQARRYLKSDYGFEQRRVRQAEGGHDPKVWRDFAEFGWLGLSFPESLGGLGLGPASVLPLAEELGRALVLEPFVETVIESGALIEALAESTQAKELAARVIAGESIVLTAHAEAGARFHPHHVETIAVANGAAVRLSGRKSQVAHARFADVFIVSTREAGGPRDSAGISLFLVPAEKVTLSESASLLIDGTWAHDLLLDGVEVSASARLGAPQQGAPALELSRHRAILALVGMSVGSMTALVEQTAQYLDTRVQFDRPLSAFQALRHKLADMAILAERARSASWIAANALLVGRDDVKQSIAVAKAEVAAAGRRVGQLAVQLHGGIGTTEELQVGHHLRFLEAMGVRFGDRMYQLNEIAKGLCAACVSET